MPLLNYTHLPHVLKTSSSRGEIKLLQLQKYRALSEPHNALSAEKYGEMVKLFRKLFTKSYPPDARCKIVKDDEVIGDNDNRGFNIQSLKIAFEIFLKQNDEKAEDVENITPSRPVARRQETTVQEGEEYAAIIKKISLETIDNIRIVLL